MVVGRDGVVVGTEGRVSTEVWEPPRTEVQSSRPGA